MKTPENPQTPAIDSAPESKPARQSDPTPNPPPSTPPTSTSTTTAPVSPNRGGRPKKLTPAVRAALFEQLARGLNYTQACQVVRISPETLRKWRRADPEFSEAIVAAEAESAGTRLDIINNASQKSWRAAAWWLERKFPHLWAPTRQLTVEDKLAYVRIDRAASHEQELSPVEIDLRTALYLPANAPDQDVQNALERAKINLMRSRAYGIPVDQLPQ